MTSSYICRARKLGKGVCFRLRSVCLASSLTNSLPLLPTPPPPPFSPFDKRDIPQTHTCGCGCDPPALGQKSHSSDSHIGVAVYALKN